MSFVVFFIISLISFGLKRGENGGVRFQVIRRTKVEKFKKVDGYDFFPIVCSSPSQAHVARINLAITSQKKKTTSARNRKRRGQDLKETK